ncbi:MAG: SDR family oxidoreductase [Bacteroidales bacterium]|nr:SDR family oxidoreductase [Bacteroidales bacterium]
MKDKIILITGSTDGIGKQTALDLARIGAKIIIHGRNNLKARTTKEEIAGQTGNENLDFAGADLGSLEEIRIMAGEISEKYERLDVLINNAGVFMNHRQMTKDGFETTFAVNHLAHFLLTGLLLDLIKKSDFARIINVASMAHASRIDFSNLQSEKYFDGYDAYSRSKLCNILFTYQLASMLEDTHVTANVLHPGVIRTKLLHAGWGGGGANLEQGAKTSVFLATSPEVKDVTGKYFSNSRIVGSSAVSYDIAVQETLWKISEGMTGFNYFL